VASGGVTSAASLWAGGSLVVSAGGAVSAGLTLHGGKAVISGTMAAGQSARFAGSTAAVLELANLAGFHAAISGLTTSNQKIDLDGFADSSTGETVAWSQTGTSGTLTIKDGAKTASLTLIGTYTSSSFNLADDGHGGTFVSDPPVLPAAVQQFAQAAAVHGGGSAAALSVAGVSGRDPAFAPVIATVSA
jgi:hypothetical protein